jgi:hypothetical protein
VRVYRLRSHCERSRGGAQAWKAIILRLLPCE